MSLFEPSIILGRMPTRDDEFHWVDDDDQAVSVGEPRQAIRLGWLFSLVAIVVLLLASRLLVLQVSEGRSHQLLAQGNRVRTRELLPPRGIITDRFGAMLATNMASFALVITPADLPRDLVERQAVYALAATLLNEDTQVIQKEVEAEGLRSIAPILLQNHLEQQLAMQYMIRIGNQPGLSVIDVPQRTYTQAPGLAHLLGYTGKVSTSELTQSSHYSYSSLVGKTGIERIYEQQLYGKPGSEQVEVNSRGYFQRALGQLPAQSGDTIKLTLDLGLQQHLGEVMAAKLAEVQASAGVGIVMDPRDGSILAMVSLPDYNNNDFTGGITPEKLETLSADPLSPLTNRAISGIYPSGSVLKPVVASAGLAEHVITEQTTLNVPAEIKIGNFVFPDWKAHGLTDVRKALAVSSDIFFYAVGGGWDKVSGLGIARLDRYLELFGFGKLTGIDLPGEGVGLVPTPDWKEQVKHEGWFTGDTYHLSIGQGDFLATPLQVASSIATIANHGTVSTPHLLLKDETVSTSDSPVTPPGSRATGIVDDQWLAIVRSGMKRAVDDGSARQLQALPVSAAGKTGTAQFGNEDKTHAWFTSYAPADNPEIAVTILIEGGGEGNVSAEPVALDVMQWYFGEHHKLYK